MSDRIQSEWFAATLEDALETLEEAVRLLREDPRKAQGVLEHEVTLTYAKLNYAVNTKLVHDTVLPEYSPAANMGDVLDVWAACKKGTQKWTEIKEDGKPVVVQFECSAQDLLDLNNTILENSRTIKRMRELFEFDDIKYRAQFVVKSNGSGFDLGGQYNDYVWKDGKKATREAEFLKLAYDGSLATDPLQYIDNPEKLSFTVESYAQILGPFYLEMRQAR